MLLAAIALAAAPAGVAPDRSARAIVRIERPAVLRFADLERSAPGRLRTVLRTVPGGAAPERLRLVDFP